MLLLSLSEVALCKPPSQSVETTLSLAARLEPAGDPVDSYLEMLLTLRQPPLALGQPLGGFTELPLGLGQILQRARTGLPRLFHRIGVRQRRRVGWRLPSHTGRCSTARFRMGHT